MRDLERLSAEEARSLEGLLFDLDDTLLDHGRLGLDAYSALHRLRESGLGLVAVTGRPAGWGEVLVRQWPIDAAVTENGAFSLHLEHGVVRRVDRHEPERTERTRRLRALVAELRERFPELTPADDVELRRTDFAFDIGEHRQVDRQVVAAARAFAHARGAHTVASSVHLHVSFDGEDKASGVVRLLSLRSGIDPTVARARWAFIGDSENDAACFAAFKTTLAVANFSGRPTVAPRYRTRAAHGAGFAEAAARLTELRA
jgi:HAD superfamily hydrolase (TIGR01484 family)